MMPWLFAEGATSDIGVLMELLKFGGAGAGAGIVWFMLNEGYKLYRKWKDGKKKDDADQVDLEMRKAEGQLALNVKEEEQIEAQLQRVIKMQDALITSLQTKRDERVALLEGRVDGLQESLKDCVEKHASEATSRKYLQEQLDKLEATSQRREEEWKANSAAMSRELEEVKIKYRTVRAGGKVDDTIRMPEPGA